MPKTPGEFFVTIILGFLLGFVAWVLIGFGRWMWSLA
jgi:hypothetical protein